MVIISSASGMAKTISARDSKRNKKKRKTEEEIGRQHQGLDRMEFGKVVRAVQSRVWWRRIVETLSSVPNDH